MVRGWPSRRLVFTAAALAVAAGSCRALPPRGEPPPPAPPAPESPPPPPPRPREVKSVRQEIVVAAWSEPKVLPPGGGQAHILVRVQKRGGAPLPGVEVRLEASHGALYSRGRILRTAANGMTRDRLTTRRSAEVTLNAGGTRYRFQVPVQPELE